jgi:hypothetical protein
VTRALLAYLRRVTSHNHSTYEFDRARGLSTVQPLPSVIAEFQVWKYCMLPTAPLHCPVSTSQPHGACNNPLDGNYYP